MVRIMYAFDSGTLWRFRWCPW